MGDLLKPTVTLRFIRPPKITRLLHKSARRFAPRDRTATTRAYAIQARPRQKGRETQVPKTGLARQFRQNSVRCGFRSGGRSGAARNENLSQEPARAGSGKTRLKDNLRARNRLDSTRLDALGAWAEIPACARSECAASRLRRPRHRHACRSLGPFKRFLSDWRRVPDWPYLS